MMTFSEKLVVLRKIKHLTQDEFASAVGVSRQAVYKWESGQSYPEAQKLIEMKLLFGVSIDDLLDDTFEIELPKKKKKKRGRKSAAELAAMEAEANGNAEVKKEEAPIVKAAPAPVVEEKKEETPAPVVKAEPAPEAEVKKEEIPVKAAPAKEEKKETYAPAAEVKKAAEEEKPAARTTQRQSLFEKLFGKK